LGRSESKAGILHTLEKTLFWSLKVCSFEKFTAALCVAKSSAITFSPALGMALYTPTLLPTTMKYCMYDFSGNL